MKRRTAWTLAGAAATAMTAGALGIALPATATEDSPYVTVAWSYASYPDITAPQPFVSSTPGANLAAFDSLAASPEWCGKPLQVEVYQRSDAHGVSWESLKATGALLYGHDGGYLAYNAGVGTPYRVITSEEYPCIATTPVTATPTPSSTPVPSTPVTPSPTPSDEPTSTLTPSAPTTSTTPAKPGSPTSSPSAAPSVPSSGATSRGPSLEPMRKSSTSTEAPAAVATSPADLHLPVVSG